MSNRNDFGDSFTIELKPDKDGYIGRECPAKDCAWCPDCGIHNSLQMLLKNLELANKELELSESTGADLADHLIKEALSTIVAGFDGFGREICSQKGVADIRFQNPRAARKKVQELFSFDFADCLPSDHWDGVCMLFQKRHLLAHKMGVMDAECVQKSKDPDSAVGRKVRVGRDEVSSMINLIELLGRRLFAGVFRP